ncbi:MAG: glycosyltransferase [Phycisphaeraceae bacterium]|nr:glycosyltransferase [Phycisphaeraceae bacterium]
MIDPRQPDFTCTPADPRRPKFGYAPAEGPRAAAEAPLVSVITPFHDDGDEFLETAACVLGQSLQAIEWIIINDASTRPESLALLEACRGGQRDPRIRVIDLEANRGPGAARNAGVRAARAPYVFLLDSDDLIEPTTLEKGLWFLETHPACAFVKGYSVAFGAKQHLWDKTFRAGERFLDHNCATITTMLRREVFLAVGGYDESIRHGMEDWEFWLKCAAAGFWGDAIPEYLDWYRRRERHDDVWHDWDGDERQKAFRERMRDRYVPVLKGRWPKVSPPALAAPLAPARRESPVGNPLAKDRPRLLMVLPWMRMGGADKFNLDLVEQLTARGWQITIATTTGDANGWMPAFARHTPDIFVLPVLVPHNDMPAMLRGLIESRRPDVVMLSNSEAAYEWLPALRAWCPEPAFIDYNHMEEEYWKSGGHPRSGAGAQPLLELNITASEHLKSWMASRGADPDRIEVCTINVDPQVWKPDPDLRRRVREELGIPADQPVILYAGRICAQKQPEVFAATIGRLARETSRTSFRAIVAGDGELRPALEKALAAEHATDRVLMLGEVPSDRMRELMAAADIFFLPSRWEGIALVIYEAMAAGVVVVGAQVGGQAELVTPDTGILLPKATPGRESQDEPPAYAKALQALITDAPRRQAMAAAARERITRHFSLSRMGDRMDALLRGAIDLHREHPRPVIAPSFAAELLDRAIESQRLARVADRMWAENRRLREALAARPAAEANPPRRTPPKAQPPSRLNRPPARPQVAARARVNGVHRPAHDPVLDELARIENSRAWRVFTALKANPVYALLARVRWGRDWRRQALVLTPAQRLEHIRASRAFRLIARLKATGLYKRYARKRYPALPPPEAPRPPHHPPEVSVVVRRDELASRP